MGQVQTALRASDADVGQPSLFFQFGGLGQRAGVREHALFHAQQEDVGELESLGRVQRHQHHAVVVVEVVGVGHQRDLLEELVDPGVLAGRPDQLAEVLEATVRLDRCLGFELGEVARHLERVLQHVGRARGGNGVGGFGICGLGGHLAEVVEQLHERLDTAQARAR